MEEKRWFAAGACSKAKILLANALRNRYVFAAALFLAAGAAVQVSGVELVQSAFADQSRAAAIPDASNMQQAPSGNSYYRSISESLSVVASHGSGSGTSSPTTYYRSISESMSVTTVQGKAPNSYSRSMLEQASLTTGMPSSAQASPQVRAAPAPYSTSSNQRIDERFSLRNLAFDKADPSSKSASAGTPLYSTDSVMSNSELSRSNAGIVILDTASIDGGESESGDHSSSTFLRQIDAFNDYILMQESIRNAAYLEASVSAVFLIGTFAVAVSNQSVVLRRGQVQKRVYAFFLLKTAHDGNSAGRKIRNPQVTYVLLMVLVIFTVSSVVKAVDPLGGQAFAAITFAGSSTASTTNGAAPIPALPSNLQDGDAMIAYFYSREAVDGTVSISSGGWTQLYNERSAGGLLAVWYKVYQAGDSAPTFTLTGHAANNSFGDTAIAQIAAWRGVDTTNPIAATGTIATNLAQQDIGSISGITLNAGETVIVVGGKTDDWTSVATLSGDGLTWTEIGDPFETRGVDAGLVWDYALNGGSGTTTVAAKTFTVTGGTIATGKGVMFSLNLPPQNFQGNPTPETLSLMDIISAKVTRRALPDSLSIAEIISISASKPVVDSVAISDTVATSVAKAVTEQMTITDEVARIVLQSRSITEQLAVTDTATKTVPKMLSEQLAVTDAIAWSITVARSMLEQFAITESIATAAVKPLSEQLGLTDTTARTFATNRTLSEQLAVTDAVAMSTSKSITEQMAMMDQIARAIISSRVVSEQLTTGETVAVSVSKLMVEQLGVIDSLQRSIITARMLSEQLAITESVSKAFSVVLSEQMILTEQLARTIALTRSMSEQLVLAESVLKTASYVLSENLGIMESIGRTIRVTIPIAEQLGLTDAIAKAVSISLTEQVGFAETIARSIVQSVYMTEQLGLTDTVVKAMGIALSDQLAIGDILARAITLTRTAAESLALQDTIAKAVSPTIMEQLTLTEAADRNMVQFRSMSDQLAVSDTMTASVVKPLSESFNMTDVVTRPAIQSRSITEQMVAQEMIAVSIEKALSEQLVLTETIARSRTQSTPLSDQLSVSDSITIAVAISVSDQLGVADSVVVTTAGEAFVTDQLGATESITIRVSKQLADDLALSDAIMITGSTSMTEPLAMTDVIARSVIIARAVSDSLALSDTTSGAPAVLVIITDSMSIDDSFADIALLIHLDLGEPLVLVQSFTTNFTGFFNQVGSEGIIIGDSVVLSLVPSGQVLNRDIIEVMEIEDSIIMLVMIPPPPPPPAISTMPDLMMTETEDLDEFGGLTDPAEAVEVDGVWNVDSLDEQGLQSLVDAIGMPVYDVDLEAISDDIGDMTMIVPAFKVSMNISGQTSDDGLFLTPTLSNLPAGLQVIIPIDVQASMNGAGNLDHLGSMIVTFTAAESTDDFAMLITLLDNNPEGTADELPNDTPAFYIDISIVGNFTGPTPSDEAFFEEPPQIKFTITEEWAQEQSVERDSNNVPIIGLSLLDEGSGEWIDLSNEIEPASAVDGIYTYTAIAPHFSTYAVTASASDDSSRGSNRDRTFTRLLSESLFVSSIANLGVPAGSEGKIVIKDITESLTLRVVQPQPLHQRVITINDITVAVSIVDVRSAATLGTAVATLNFEFINKGITSEELVLRFWYPDPAGSDIVYEAEQTITAGAGESIVEEVIIPFSSPGLYDVMIEVESEDGILSTTDIVVDVPWLTVYLYILIVIAIIVVLASIAYVIYAMRRSGLFIIGGK